MTVSVRDNPTESRFEVYAEDQLAGFAEYEVRGDATAFTHTETDSAFAGRGLAKQLVAEALDEVRGRGLQVLPECPFVRKFIAEHPDYLDLVATDERERFDLPTG